jgi:hypothetical protein
MFTLELKASDVVTTTRRSNVKSHDFTIIWSYAIAAIVVLAVIHAVSAAPDGSLVDFASLSTPL